MPARRKASARFPTRNPGDTRPRQSKKPESEGRPKQHGGNWIDSTGYNKRPGSEKKTVETGKPVACPSSPVRMPKSRRSSTGTAPTSAVIRPRLRRMTHGTASRPWTAGRLSGWSIWSRRMCPRWIVPALKPDGRQRLRSLHLLPSLKRTRNRHRPNPDPVHPDPDSDPKFIIKKGRSPSCSYSSISSEENY